MWDEKVDHAGKVALITGCTGTIGSAIAEKLARLKVKLRLVCLNRNEDDRRLAEGLVSSLKRETGNQDIEILYGDISSLEDTKRMVDEYLSRNEPLDILINNAGVFFLKGRVDSVDGIEMTLAVNFIGPFVLTLRLLDRLKKSKQASIVNVASGAYIEVKNYEEDFEICTKATGYSPRQYDFSKLALIHFTRILAKRLEGTTVIVNALHPGAVPSNMWKGLPFRMSLRLWKGRILAPLIAPGQILTPQESAKTPVYLAISPKFNRVSGRYFFREKEQPLSEVALNDIYAQRTWDFAVRLTGVDYPEEARLEAAGLG